MRRSTNLAALCLIAQAMLVNSAWAFNYSWNNSAGGTFADDANWTKPMFVTGYPDDGTDTAIFSLFAVYTVEFFGDVTNNNAVVNTGTVTWDLYRDPIPPLFPGAPVDYTLDASSGPAALVGSNPGSLFPATLVVNGRVEGLFQSPSMSNVFASRPLHIGAAADSVGAVELDVANWISTSGTVVGLDGMGSLQIDWYSTMENGSVTVGSGVGSSGTVTVEGNWTANGVMTVGGLGSGVVTISVSGELVSDDVVMIAAQNGSSGTINVGGDWISNDSVYIGGTGTEAGGVGRLAVGNGNNVPVAGDLKIWSGGTLALEEGSQLTVAGTANLDGTLEFLLAAMTEPKLDDEFPILTATGGVAGAFSSTNLPPLDGGLRWTVDYEPTSVSLRVAPSLPGDYNVDGIVNAADYAVWRDSLGSSATLPNDSTPGVGADDYDRWHANFGNSAAGAGISSQNAVPEPAGLLLAVVAAICLPQGRRLMIPRR